MDMGFLLLKISVNGIMGLISGLIMEMCLILLFYCNYNNFIYSNSSVPIS